jgi:hypothetical protein
MRVMSFMSFALSAGLLLLAESAVRTPSPAGPVPVPYPNTEGPEKDTKTKDSKSDREPTQKQKSFSSEPVAGGGRPSQSH